MSTKTQPSARSVFMSWTVTPKAGMITTSSCVMPLKSKTPPVG